MKELGLLEEINRLEQITIEDQYSRKNIRARIIEDVTAGVCSSLKNNFINMIECIDNYKAQVYYKSKEDRLWNIRHISSAELAAEIIIAIIDVTSITSIQPVVAKLGLKLEYEDTLDGIKTAAELLAVCINTNMYTMWVDPMRIRSDFQLNNETLAFIEGTQYMMPSIVPMKDWTNNSNGGYITHRNSTLLGKHHHHEDKQCLDTINILQSIEWELDEEAMNQPRVSKKPLDTEEKKLNFKLLVDSSKVVYKKMIELGNSFFIEWRQDFRGREYDSGYHIHFQSGEYEKSIMDFKHKEVIET